MIRIGDISIDCKNPEKLRDFYFQLTNWERKTMYGCPALIVENGLVILFMECDFEYIPPVWPEEEGKQQKQMHFNLQVTDLINTVTKAIELGATCPSTQYGGNDFVTLLDPEGHPFCLCKKDADGNLVVETDTTIKRMPTHCGSKVCASCVVAGDYVFIAHHTGTYKDEDMASQTRNAIENIEKTLATVGATIKDIVQLRYYISDKSLYSLGAAVFNEYFAENNIARTTIITDFLDEQCLCQIDGVAYLPRK